MKKLSMYMLASALAFTLCAEELKNPYESRFGVCAHLSRGEYSSADAQMQLMRQAGIRFFRTDMDWAPMKPRKDAPYDFSRWDGLVEKSQRNNMGVLPILLAIRPTYARPISEHTDEVYGYTKGVVEHFKGKIPYWEIVNEANIAPFWDKQKPDPKKYTEVLSQAHKAIKEVDKDAKVLFTGTAGVPYKYIEDVLKAGGAKYFDIMNIHPYQWSKYPELDLIKQINKLQALLKKYNAADKPIWITEIGNSSGTYNPMVPQVIDSALKYLGIPQQKNQVVVIEDKKYLYSSFGIRGDSSGILNSPKSIKKIAFEGIKKLDAKKNPILLLASNETFPQAFVSDLYDYVARGGTIISAGGFPMFYDLQLKENDTVVRKPIGKHGASAFRFGNPGADIVKKKYPESVLGTLKRFEVAEGFEGIKPTGFMTGLRFTDTSKLKAGDKYIPILYGVYKDVKAPIAGIYKYGDLKGNFIAINPFLDSTISEKSQAKFIARQLLIAYSQGIEKVFVYNFRAHEIDYSRESHFGIIRKNHELKPAYHAYKTVVKMLGETAKPNFTRKNNICIADWKRADGCKVYAIWSIFDNHGKETIDVDGEVVEAYNIYGKPMKVKARNGKITLKLNGEVNYVVIK